MDYVIRNKNLYIKLDHNGTPITCGVGAAQRFEYSKACNIVKSLPKQLKRMNFNAEAVPEIEPPKKISSIRTKKNKRILDVPKEEIPECVTRWVNKVECLNGLAKEAASRKIILEKDLVNIQRKELDLLHEIELSYRVNACDGYKKFRELKNVLEKRREIKDELMIVNDILESDIGQIAADKIKKCVEGLKTRKYTYRTQD